MTSRNSAVAVLAGSLPAGPPREACAHCLVIVTGIRQTRDYCVDG